MVRSIPRPLVRANQTFFVLSVVTAALLHAPWVLSITLVIAAAALAFGPKGNLVMRLTQLVLARYIDLKEAAQEDAVQQRFNQTLAVTMLAASQISFYLMHSAVLGWVFAGLLLAAAAIALAGFCIGCWIHFRLHMYRARRALARKA